MCDSVFPLVYLKQGGPPCLNLEHHSKWVGFNVIIELKAREYHLAPCLNPLLEESLRLHVHVHVCVHIQCTCHVFMYES